MRFSEDLSRLHDPIAGRYWRNGRIFRAIAVASFVVLVMALFAYRAYARDADGRYANSPLKSWFDGLRSGRGPCCSDADGTALSDVDWETSKDGKHYRVRVQDQWIDVPDDAVLTEPNRAGKTMVWPVYEWDSQGHPTRIVIRCFMPGPMT